MKYLILLLFLALAISCAEPEVIEKIIREPVYITQTVSNTDTLIVEKEVVKDSIVYRERIVYDTITNTVLRIEIDTVYVPTFITVVDTVYVERKSEITYDPILKPYVENFFVLAAGRISGSTPLNVDVILRVDNDYGVISWTDIIGGKFVITIGTDGNCYEAGVYRELLHTLYAYSYIYSAGHPMIQNWEGCLEMMDDTMREYTLDNMFYR
jgi:hypothetical protein